MFPSDKLPFDMVESIYYSLPYDQRGKIFYFSKDLYNKYLIEKKSASKIQKFFRRNRVTWDNYDIIMNSRIKKKYLIRIYMATYPEKHLYTYPDFFVKKIERNIRYEENFHIFMAENPPTKTRRFVKKFLELDTITCDDIHFVGW